MFKKLSFVNKIISLFFMLFILLLIPASSYLFIPALLLVVAAFVSKRKKHMIVALLFLLVTFVLPNMALSMNLYKIILFIVFALFIESTMLADERRFVFSFITNRKLIDNDRIISRYYSNELMSDIEFDNSLIYKYAVDNDEKRKYRLYLKEESVKILKQEANYKYLVDKIRFGTYNDKRKNTVVKTQWTEDDNLYLALFIFAFIVAILLRIL